MTSAQSSSAYETVANADNQPFILAMETALSSLTGYLQEKLTAQENFTLEFTAENSQFTRFNHAKVRQTGIVTDGSIELTLMAEGRRSFRTLPVTGDRSLDLDYVAEALASLRDELPQLPPDPYLVLPEGNATSQDVYSGNVLSPEHVPTELLTPVADLDFTGIYAGGTVIRGYADSVGQLHWFATESYTLDYSIFTPDGQAVKGTLAGREWDNHAYQAQLETSRQQLDQMAVTPKSITPGQYRTYFAPAAVAELVSMLSWEGLSEGSLQKGSSALNRLRRGDATLSPYFTLKENFSHGLVPRFNDIGEVAPLSLPLIEQGQLLNSLVSARTAKEYGIESNGAANGEGLRSPEVSPGTLAADDALKSLDTGLYVSNLHYLNWSDRPSGRITGMTRYACFWVEKGEIVAPIESLRFDDSLYRFWGDQLIALTNRQEFIAEVETYERRAIGGLWVPGMLVDGFTYTL